MSNEDDERSTVAWTSRSYDGDGYSVGHSVLATDGETTVVKGLRAGDAVEEHVGPEGSFVNLRSVDDRENVLVVGQEPFDEVFDGLRRDGMAAGDLFDRLVVPDSRSEHVAAALSGDLSGEEGPGLVDVVEEFDEAEVGALAASGFDPHDVEGVDRRTDLGPASIWPAGDGLALSVGERVLAPNQGVANYTAELREDANGVGIAVPPSFRSDEGPGREHEPERATW